MFTGGLMSEVSVVECKEYEYEKVREAVFEAVDAVGGFSVIKAGTKVAIKANLVASATPDAATTTHPYVLAALCDILSSLGAFVVVGDSPGGLYNSVVLEKIYKTAGVYECEKHGGRLNRDFSEANAVWEDALVAKTFTYTAYLDDVDVIINACKLKTHGMMGLSCAAKNMFGAIPGTMKPEYHFRYPSYEAFANMLVDLDEYFKPYISVCDAVVGMEGNGPTAGNPRKIGCIIASRSPHKLDMVAAQIIGLDADSIPTLAAAKERSLVPKSIDELDIYGNYQKYQISDYDNIAIRRSLQFKGNSDNVLKNIFGNVAKTVLDSSPKLSKSHCIGCNKCGKICPAKAIVIKNGKAQIDRSRCIKCFCCQEFCPVGAMKVHRTWLARILQRNRKNSKSAK